jgi:ketosteroid isomerase-like protein
MFPTEDADIPLLQFLSMKSAIRNSVFFGALALAMGGSLMVAASSGASPADDARAVAALDTEYQAAVERNDAATMDRILADDFVLVVGKGTAYTKADLLKSARDKDAVYEHQVEIDNSQKVRVWGDTAVVTAKLWLKGTQGGEAFDKKLWFSDTYVRTKSGWKYVFGQSSIALPKEP